MTGCVVTLLERAKEYGEHATIGVLWDYCSLPQKPYRSDDEAGTRASDPS